MYGSHLFYCLILAQLLITVLPADYHHMYKRQNRGKKAETYYNPDYVTPPAGFGNSDQGDYHHMNKRRAGAGAEPAVPNNSPGHGASNPDTHDKEGKEEKKHKEYDPGLTIDTRGTEFIFCFQSNVGNVRPSGLRVMVGVGGPDFTSVDVSVPAFKFSVQFDLDQGETEVVDIPPGAAAIGSGPQNGTVWVRANRPVTVHGVNMQQKSNDGFLAIPSFALGLEYFVMSYPARGLERSQMLVTGVHDYTRVTIEPLQRILFKGKWYNIGDSILFGINRFESIQIQAPGDLTGTRILSDKPVSVMTGATCSLVPANLNRCDHLVENIPPVATWGRRFTVLPFRNRTTGHVVRILAARKNTRFTTLGQVFMLQKPGLFREINQPVTFPMTIISDKPLLVVQFAKGGAIDKTGDPFMTVVPPVEQYVRGAVIFNTFSESGKDKFRSFASISVTSWDLFNIHVNNEPLLTHSYKYPSQKENMRLATFNADYQMPLKPGGVNLVSPAPGSRFTAIIYGFAEGTSYGFPAVYGLRKLLCSSVDGAAGDAESDCTGPIVSHIPIYDKYGHAQKKPKAPLYPGQPRPPGFGNNDAPGWGSFYLDKTGTAWEEMGGGDAGVFFPWYTISPWFTDRWAEEQNDDDSECYTTELITVGTVAPSIVVFIVMLVILIAAVNREDPEKSDK